MKQLEELGESQCNEPTGGMHNSTIAKNRWRPEKDKPRSQEQRLCVKRDRECFSSYIASQVRDADLRASLHYLHIKYQSETTEGEETKSDLHPCLEGIIPLTDDVNRLVAEADDVVVLYGTATINRKDTW